MGRPTLASRTVARTLGAIAVAALPLLGSASVARAGSVFAVGGLGEPTLQEDARIRALGGAGVAEQGPSEFSNINPASIAGSQHLALQATFLSSIRNTKSTRYGSQSAYDPSFPNIRLILKLPKRFVIGASYILGTNADFNIVRPESSGAASTLEIEGAGGIEYARLGLAHVLGKGLSAGVDYEMIGGNYSELWVRRFANPNYLTALDTLKITWDRLGRWRFGLTYAGSGGWSLGAEYETQRTLPLTFRQTTPGTVTLETGRSLTIPSGYAAGFSAPLGGRQRVVGQYQRILWDPSSLESDLVSFRWEERYSVGFERRAPARSANVLGRMPIRMGYTYLRWPDLLPVAGASDISGGTAGVTEWAVSLGSGTYTADHGGRLDFALEYGKRGNLDTLGASESFLRLSISIQVTDETWK
jgi:hypothetical protein